MAKGETLDCSSPTLSVDPDVVGPGVLTAFIATATITILAVIFGYLSDALDDDLLNFLDRRIIHWTRTKWNRLKVFLRLVEETATHHHPLPHHMQAMAGIRKEVITQFILTLSDQQLVTGLAVLIAAVCNQRTLTGYQFSVVLSQAWFSSTTHMATLDGLRNYLGSHGIVRDLRVTGMMAVLILLIYTFVVSFLTRSRKLLPVQCLFNDSSLYDTTYYGSRGSAGAYTLGVITFTYLFRIQDLYVRQKSPSYFPGWLIWRRRRPPGSSSYREYFAEKRARARFQAACNLADASYLKRIGYMYGDSFLSSIPGTAFSYAYGVTLVVVTRWKMGPGSLPSEAAQMGFGQIMPLLLLCLPFLAAGESYYDYLHKRYQHLAAAAAAARNYSDPEQHHHNHHHHHHHSKHSPPSEEAKDTDIAMPSHPPPKPTNPSTNDLLLSAEKFDQDRSRIEKYFYNDVHNLHHLPATTDGSGSSGDRQMEILQRKQSIAMRYQSVEEFERHLKAGPAIAMFVVSLLLSVSMGVLLNVGDDVSLLACIALGVLSVVLKFVVGARSP